MTCPYCKSSNVTKKKVGSGFMTELFQIECHGCGNIRYKKVNLSKWLNQGGKKDDKINSAGPRNDDRDRHTII